MAELEQHLTTEQLSAFLDEQLSPEEQPLVREHLENCVPCEQRLTGLRQTVTLLRALPQPPLPRSFVLPVPETSAASAEAAPHVIHLSERKKTRDTYTRSILRAVSGLAAVVGIFFLLSALLSAVVHPFTYQAASSSASSNSGGSSAAPQAAPRTPAGVINPHGSMEATNEAESGTARPTPGSDTSATPTYSDGQPQIGPAKSNVKPVDQPTFTLLSLFDLSTLQGKAIFGLFLLLLGLFGLGLFKRKRDSSV